ncbi:hypothetical protein G9A89_016930 [Geosiphon pyriformis]|nr:hypothetical protein G9A89_016930 [Geosiphon pyriformis]
MVLQPSSTKYKIFRFFLLFTIWNHILLSSIEPSQSTQFWKRADQPFSIPIFKGPGRYRKKSEKKPAGRYQIKNRDTTLRRLQPFAPYAREASCLNETNDRITDEIYARITKVNRFKGTWLLQIRGEDLKKEDLESKKIPTSQYQNIKGAKVDEQYYRKFQQASLKVFRKFLSIERSHNKSHARTSKGIRTMRIVGFGLGGVYALLIGAYFQQKLPITITIFTYGMPRVGNRAFANHINTILPQRVYRITNTYDIVPTLPRQQNKSDKEYIHPGIEIWLGTDDCDCRPNSFGPEGREVYRPIFECVGLTSTRGIKESEECINQVTGLYWEENAHYGPYRMSGFYRMEPGGTGMDVEVFRVQDFLQKSVFQTGFEIVNKSNLTEKFQIQILECIYVIWISVKIFVLNPALTDKDFVPAKTTQKKVSSLKEIHSIMQIFNQKGAGVSFNYLHSYESKNVSITYTTYETLVKLYVCCIKGKNRHVAKKAKYSPFLSFGALTCWTSVNAQKTDNSTASKNPPGRYGHCSVTWKNKFYVFGGWDNNPDETGANTSPFFYSTTLPINSNKVVWKFLNTDKATSVGSAACVVTPSGYLLVFGGLISLRSSEDKIPTQVFDLKKEVWIDWHELMTTTYPGYGLNPKAVLISPDFISVYAGNTGVNENGKRLPTQYYYFLDIKKKPWTWFQLQKDETFDAPIPRIMAAAKGNVWAFGGYFPFESGDNVGFSNKLSISNKRNQWVIPDSPTIPYGIREGAIGIRGNLIFLIAYHGSDQYPVNVFPLDMSTMQYQPNILFRGMRGRASSSFAQFPGSDAVLIYGGCPFINTTSQCSSPFEGIQIFNMTERNWTLNHNIVTNIPSNGFTIPKIKGIDFNAENDQTIPNKSISNGNSIDDKRMPTWLVIFISSLATAAFAALTLLIIIMLQRHLFVPKGRFEITQRSQRNIEDGFDLRRPAFPNSKTSSMMVQTGQNSSKVSMGPLMDDNSIYRRSNLWDFSNWRMSDQDENKLPQTTKRQSLSSPLAAPKNSKMQRHTKTLSDDSTFGQALIPSSIATMSRKSKERRSKSVCSTEVKEKIAPSIPEPTANPRMYPTSDTAYLYEGWDIVPQPARDGVSIRPPTYDIQL